MSQTDFTVDVAQNEYLPHLHAVLIAEPDGGWAVLDPGSANGTLVNGREMATGARSGCAKATASASAPGQS